MPIDSPDLGGKAAQTGFQTRILGSSNRQGKVIPLQPSWLSLSPQGAVIKLDPHRAVKDGNERGGDEQQPGREGPLSPSPERRQCLFRLDSGQALPSYSLLAL